MHRLKSLGILLILIFFIFPEIAYGTFSESKKYSIPERLQDQLHKFGFNEAELEEISVDGGILSIKMDSEELDTERAYKIISFICDYTKNYPNEWQGIEFEKIEVMDFTQSDELIFNGGIKNCLKLPFKSDLEKIKPYAEIKSNY